MYSRGRDRAVSSAARARQRSEDRMRSPLPSTTTPTPTHTYSRSPSPPRTPPLSLADQVHIAYADDDIHLAKVLLLRLQGIEVTSDDDPRIAAVRDEDFDACFIPFGRLDDGRGEASTSAVKSVPAAHTTPAVVPDTRGAAVRRADALKEKERLWESEARRYTEERLRCAALRRSQAERTLMDEERIRLIKQKEAAAAAVDLRRRRMKPTSRTLNFSLVPPLPQPPVRFTYDFPFTVRANSARAVPPPPPLRRSPRRSPQRQDEAPEPNRVSFPQVLACMHGELFPELPGERMISRSADHAQAHHESVLFDILLSPVNYSGKGKARAEPRRCLVCMRSPSPLPSPSTPSTSSSGLSRASSWLSFASSSRSSTLSISTAASSLVPESPSLSTPKEKAPLRLWLAGSRRTASPSPTLLCSCPREVPRQPVLIHPLVPPEPPAPPRRALHMAEPLAGAAEFPVALPFTLALGRLVAMARNLQASYVRAVVAGYGGVSPEWEEDLGVYKDEPMQSEKSPSPPPPTRVPPLASKLQLRPAGARASRAAVHEFLAPTNSHPVTPPSLSSTTPTDDELVPVAPLSLLAPSRSSPHVPRTQLPARLPYTTVFSAPLPLPRSPWAPAPSYARPPTTGPVPCSVEEALERTRRGLGLEQFSSAEHEASAYASADTCADADWEAVRSSWMKREPVLRARAVPNSSFLRLKALHNDALMYLHSDEAGMVMATRRPREAVLGLGVNRHGAVGSGLRFVTVYAGEVVS